MLDDSRKKSPEKYNTIELKEQPLQNDELSQDEFPPEQKPAYLHNRNQSISSQGIEEYDSKKYIDYLDGDVYPEDHPNNHITISKHQQ